MAFPLAFIISFGPEVVGFVGQFGDVLELFANPRVRSGLVEPGLAGATFSPEVEATGEVDLEKKELFKYVPEC